MKPLQWAVLGAVLAVAAIVYLLNLSADDGRHQDRRAVEERSEDGRRGAGSTAVETDGGQADGAQAADKLAATLKIVRADGSPAGAAELTLTGPSAQTSSAGADGSVELVDLRPGLYNLIASSGKQAGALDFELKETTDLGTLGLTETISIRGHVFNAAGAPIASAHVEAIHAFARGGFDMSLIVRAMMSPDRVVARTVAGEDGAYELRVPVGSDIALRAFADGFAQEGEDPRRYSADVDGLDFHLFDGVELAGIVVDKSGSPIVGAHVLLINTMAFFQRRIPKVEAVTGPDGRFRATTAPTSNQLLTVRAVGYAASMNPNPTLPSLNLRIMLSAGIAVRLRAVDAAQAGVPAPDVQVAVMYRGGFAAGKTDDMGELLLENLPIEGSRMMGNQQQAIFWGGGFVSHMEALGSHEPVQGVLDLGEIALNRGGKIKGKVIDKATGEPIEGVMLRTIGGLSQQLEFMGSSKTKSEADGSYELTGVPLKAHTVLAMHADYISNVDPMQMMQTMGASRGKSLFPQGKNKIDWPLELHPASSLEGVVLGPDGSPIAGARVSIQDPMAMFRGMMGGTTQTAVSDAQGKFTLNGLKQGETVRVLSTHREFGSSKIMSAKSGEPLTLTLTEPLTLKGIVVDSNNSPLSGVRVNVSTPSANNNSGMMAAGQNPNAGVRPAVTDSNGRFTVRNAPPGRLKVSWDHREYAPLSRSIEVAPGTSEYDLGRTELQSGLGLKGVVVDEEGKPVPNVTVHANFEQVPGAVATTPSGADGSSPQGRTNGNNTSDEQGRFVIGGLREGKFRIQAWQSGAYSTRPVVTAGTNDVRITLMAAGSLSGRVTSGGKPVANANIAASIPKSQSGGDTGRDNIGWARSDMDGEFRLESLPPDQAFRIEIRHDGHKILTQEGVRSTKEPQVFVLDAGVQIGGIVTDASGTPEAKVAVWVRAANDSKHVTTDAEGRFTAGGLADGELTVQVQSWNRNIIATEPISVTPGDMNIHIAVEKGETIAGFILDAEGKPLKQIQVAALDDDGKQVASGWAWKDDGSFEIKGLRPGRYRVRASRWVDQKNEVLAETDDVATGTLDLELRATR